VLLSKRINYLIYRKELDVYLSVLITRCQGVFATRKKDRKPMGLIQSTICIWNMYVWDLLLL